MLEVLYFRMAARGDGYPMEGNLPDFGNGMRGLEIQEQALILQLRDGGELVVALYLHPQSLGGIHQTVDDAVRILRLRKHALVILCNQWHAVLLKPVEGMLVVESLEESLHQFMSAGVRLFQVGNLVKGIGKIASSSSRDFHLGENLRILFEYGNVGVREVALGLYRRKESCGASTDDCNM